MAASTLTINCITCNSTGFIVENVPCRECHRIRCNHLCRCFDKKPTFCENHPDLHCTAICYDQKQVLCCDGCVESWNIVKTLDDVCRTLDVAILFARRSGFEQMDTMTKEHAAVDMKRGRFQQNVLAPFLAAHAPSTPKQHASLAALQRKLDAYLDASANFSKKWDGVRQKIHDRLMDIEYYVRKRVHVGTLVNLDRSTQILNCVFLVVRELHMPIPFDCDSEYAQLVRSFNAK